MCSTENEKGQSPVYGLPGIPVFIGGPTGDYKVLADIPSSRWVEYRILSISNGNGQANIVISGRSVPKALDYSGNITYNDDSHGYGEAYIVGANLTAYPQTDWRRVTSSEKRVYMRIDTTGGACILTLQFRPCILEVVPGPFVTVHPDHAHQMNIAREQNVNARLAQLGIPGYAQEQK